MNFNNFTRDNMAVKLNFSTRDNMKMWSTICIVREAINS